MKKKTGRTLEEVYEARKVTGESEFWIKRGGELQQLFCSIDSYGAF